MTFEQRILKLAGVSEHEIMIATGRQSAANESMMGEIIFKLEDYMKSKAQYPHLHKGQEIKIADFAGQKYAVVANDWS